MIQSGPSNTLPIKKQPSSLFQRSEAMRLRPIVLLGIILPALLIWAQNVRPAIETGPPESDGPLYLKDDPKAYFTQVTDEVGLTGLSGFRLSTADLNHDGYPDIFLHIAMNEGTGDVLDKQFLYLNLPGGTPGSREFVDYTAASNIRANRQGTPDGRHSNSAVFADVDNDGDLDIFTLVYVHSNYTLNEGTNDLLLNDGSGHFELAPNSPFHSEPIYNTAGAVFMDYNNDGSIDLFIGNWYMDNVLSTDHLYRGHGDGSFDNVTAAAGIDTAVTSIYGVAAFDWDNDGWIDLFAPSYSHTRPAALSRHWRNNRDGTFTQVQDETNYSQYTGYGTGVASFGSMPYDFDHDGDMDFLEILVHGTGDGEGSVHTTTVINENDVFTWDFARVDGRAAEDPRIGHHGDHYASWFDFDNDGFSDFILTESGYDNNRIYLFRQASDHTFSPVTPLSGLDEINDADLPPHNALAFDYDLDGDEDLLVGFGSTDGIQLWRNDMGTQNHWINITVKGMGGPGFSNKSAIGARVRITAGGRTQTRELYAGNGHHGPQMPLCLSFGLGQETLVDTIEVRWPNEDRTINILKNVAADQFIMIQEHAEPAIMTGPGPGSSNPPEIRVFNPERPDPHIHAFNAYGPTKFGSNVGAGQLDNAGFPDIVTGPGPGAIFGPHVRGWHISGRPFQGMNFMAYGTSKFGVNVALANLDADPYDEILTGPGPGAVFGPHVRAFNYDNSPPVEPIAGAGFFAYGTRKWGVNVAGGDIDGDGYDEVITGPGPGAVFGPHVRSWNIDGNGAAAIREASFMAYGTRKFGVNVGSGDGDGDGYAEIFTAPGPSHFFSAHIRGWNYDNASISPLPGCSFLAWPDTQVRYGARIFSGADLDGNGRDELIVGCGPDPSAPPQVNVYDYHGSEATLGFSFQAYGSSYTHGVNVAAGQIVSP